MVLFFVEMNVLAEKRKEVWQTISSLVAHIKTEEGCVEAGFYQNAEEANNFLFLGRWTDRDSLDDYLKSVQFTVLFGIRCLLSQEPKIMIGEVAPISRDRQSIGRLIV
ncbi:MAG TPA: putative quinol monooxygenase [Desulfobacterales bacterium]